MIVTEGRGSPAMREEMGISPNGDWAPANYRSEWLLTLSLVDTAEGICAACALPKPRRSPGRLPEQALDARPFPSGIPAPTLVKLPLG